MKKLFLLSLAIIVLLIYRKIDAQKDASDIQLIDSEYVTTLLEHREVYNGILSGFIPHSKILLTSFLHNHLYTKINPKK